MAGFVSYMDNASSTVCAAINKNISQMMGYIDTGGVNGATTIPLPPVGRTAFYYIADLSPNLNGQGRRPGVTMSGTSLSWDYSYSTGFGEYAMNCRIHYGYY